MKHQSDKMRASITSFEFCNSEKETKEKTDKEFSDDENSDN